MINLLVWLWLVIYNRKDKWNAVIIPPIVTLIFWFFISGGIVGNIVKSNPGLHTTHDWLIGSSYIKSIKFDNRYSGSFVLGTGSISSRDYYYVFTYSNDRKWLKQMFPMESTYIREVETQPKALFYRRTMHSSFYKTWFWGIENFLEISEFYILEVPKNTLVEEYKL